MMVPGAGMKAAELSMSNFRYWSKSDLLVEVMVPDAERSPAEVILSNFRFGQKVTVGRSDGPRGRNEHC